jgi:hypothetical protein
MTTPAKSDTVTCCHPVSAAGGTAPTDQEVAEDTARVAGDQGEDAYSEHIQPILHADGGSAHGEDGSAHEVQRQQQTADLDVPGQDHLRVRHGALALPLANDT